MSALRAVLMAIAGITVASGATQVVAPTVVLGLLGAQRSATTAQLFATVGMFMVVVGALLLHSLIADREQRIVVLWSSIQKFLAFAFVSWGVLTGVFSPLALGVALFDLATSVLLVVFLTRRRAAS